MNNIQNYMYSSNIFELGIKTYETLNLLDFIQIKLNLMLSEIQINNNQNVNDKLNFVPQEVILRKPTTLELTNLPNNSINYPINRLYPGNLINNPSYSILVNKGFIINKTVTYVMLTYSN